MKKYFYFLPIDWTGMTPLQKLDYTLNEMICYREMSCSVEMDITSKSSCKI